MALKDINIDISKIPIPIPMWGRADITA